MGSQKNMIVTIFLVFIIPISAEFKPRDLPDRLKVDSVVMIGCKHCSLTLNDFVDRELVLFHNVRFEEQNGYKKTLLRFENIYNHKIAEVDVTNYAFAEVVLLLKNQGFYRRRYVGQKLTEKQEQAPFVKWKYRK